MKNMKLAVAILKDGRTQGAIAKEAGIDGCTLNLIINLRRVPRYDTAFKIAAALGKKPTELGLPDMADLTATADRRAL